MLDFCISYSFRKCCCIFSIQWSFPLLFTFKIFEKSSLVGLKISVALKLHYSIAILLYISGFCSYSLFQFFYYQCKPFYLKPIIFFFFLHLFANQASILLLLILSLRILLSIMVPFSSLHFISACELQLLLQVSLLLV